MKILVMLCSACGVGKSTVVNEISKKDLLQNFVCVDTDEVGINWWDYAGTENESAFTGDCLSEAVKIAKDRDILFGTCTSPHDFYDKTNVPKEITSVFYIGMTCSDEEIKKRLKARPAERMCGSDEFIASQIEYNNWIKNNSSIFQCCVDNTDITAEETAEKIAEYVQSIKTI